MERQSKKNKLIKTFLEDNHIQGFVGSKIKIGLFYDFIKSKYDIDFNKNEGLNIVINMFKNNEVNLSPSIVEVLKRNKVDIFLTNQDGESVFQFLFDG